MTSSHLVAEARAAEGPLHFLLFVKSDFHITLQIIILAKTTDQIHFSIGLLLKKFKSKR